MTKLIETDSRCRVTLTGHPSQKFVVREMRDGTVILEPAIVVTEAQSEYDSTPELRDLLARAAASPTVHRTFPRTRTR